MFFADTLKKLRGKRGITQKELALTLGVSERTVRKYESGEMQPSTDKLLQLAELFNVSVDYLLGKQVSAEALQKYVADLSSAELTALQEFINEQLQDNQR